MDKETKTGREKEKEKKRGTNIIRCEVYDTASGIGLTLVNMNLSIE